MNKFIKLTAYSSGDVVYFNVSNITKIESNNFCEAYVYTSDKKFSIVKEKAEEIMHLINN